MGRAWVLNIDAEIELEGRTSSAATRARVATYAERVAATLPEGDVVLGMGGDEAARGLTGVAWCPTPRALEALRRAGAEVPDAPPLEVLRRVNDRTFALEIEALPGARALPDMDAVRAALDRPGRWRLRRGLGFAGRGVRVVDAAAISDEDLAFARASFSRGSLVVEPEVEVTFQVSLHGRTEGDTGEVTVQEVDAYGQWLGSRLAEDGELEADEARALRLAFLRARGALRKAGYHGPFGIDGFRWTDAEGASRFHPLSDLNARYTMGWPVGMGGW